MDRREMLEQSLKGLAKSLPSVIGSIGGLGVITKLINHQTDETCPDNQASCFPSNPNSEKSLVQVTEDGGE